MPRPRLQAGLRGVGFLFKEQMMAYDEDIVRVDLTALCWLRRLAVPARCAALDAIASCAAALLPPSRLPHRGGPMPRQQQPVQMLRCWGLCSRHAGATGRCCFPRLQAKLGPDNVPAAAAPSGLWVVLTVQVGAANLKQPVGFWHAAFLHTAPLGVARLEQGKTQQIAAAAAHELLLQGAAAGRLSIQHHAPPCAGPHPAACSACCSCSSSASS